MALDFKSDRDKVGRDDMVMLSEISEQSLLKNLEQRYKDGLIYTSIGAVLVSMNPYKDVGVFTQKNIERYNGKQAFELPPHVYSLADETYRALISENENQCIIISGESGAGKTEAAKAIMQYIAAISGSGTTVDNVKAVVLESNPLLESFGNAKTLRNNNSSRFGKYIEIQFDFKGDPLGGRITNYLLEKSRVVGRTEGERSFHIFYQLFQSPEKNSWKLGDINDFRYLSKSKSTTADGINDAEWLKNTQHAMGTMNLSSAVQGQIFQTLAAILHLGNINFLSTGEKANVSNANVLNDAASLLGVQANALEKALLFRTITSGTGARTSTYQTPNTQAIAEYARDALAKGIYSRLFDFMVSSTNAGMVMQSEGNTIGILDIYGFEIFKINSFEQLCINFVNETLHQIFIDLTLKTEQAEYVREGIKWEPVQYVDNKPVVDLINGKPFGILSILDEECLFPKGDDNSYCTKMNKNLTVNKNFVSQGNSATHFTIKHYAGSVTYAVEGFLDKNRDTLFNDLILLCTQSTTQVLRERFEGAIVSGQEKKRPETAGFQFRVSVEKLLKSLYACQPHYIRTIKPNAEKKPLTYDPKIVTEQVQYLGLLENLRVRRAGYCYRNTYEKWMERYYMISAETFPWFHGEPKQGVEALIRKVEYQENEYAYGKTKIFIRNPESLYKMETTRLKALNDIANKIQAIYRAWKVRKEYIKRRDEARDIFRGQKERNRNSMAVSSTAFFGDFLGFSNNDEIQKKITSGESQIIFSDIVKKVNKRDKVQERALVMTTKAVYNFEKFPKPKKTGLYEIKRRISFDLIGSISLSKLSDNYFVIHVPNEYDYVIETPKKTILVTLLKDQMKRFNGKDLSINFANQIQYKLKDKKTIKTLNFIKDEQAMTNQMKKQKGGLQISKASGIME